MFNVYIIYIYNKYKYTSAAIFYVMCDIFLQLLLRFFLYTMLCSRGLTIINSVILTYITYTLYSIGRIPISSRSSRIIYHLYIHLYIIIIICMYIYIYIYIYIYLHVRFRYRQLIF